MMKQYAINRALTKTQETKRATIIYRELVHLLTIAEYVRANDPDFVDYVELFERVREIINR